MPDSRRLGSARSQVAEVPAKAPRAPKVRATPIQKAEATLDGGKAWLHDQDEGAGHVGILEQPLEPARAGTL